MFSETVVTLDIGVLVGLLACAAGLGAVAAHGASSVKGQLDKARAATRTQGALAERLRKDAFNREINDASQRPPPLSVKGHETLLRAKIDHLKQIQQIWGNDTRQNAMEQIAAIMKRSVRASEGGRPSDVVNEVGSDGFAILVRGVEEKDAGLIAKRLRKELARTRIEGLSSNVRLTASFGIAGRRASESCAQWRTRAEDALQNARAKGEDHIVEASEMQEIKLLAPPSPPLSPSLKAASQAA